MKKLHSLAATLTLVLACTAQAGVTYYHTTLGPEATGATGTGSASASFDDATNVFTFLASFSGLSGLTTQAHFHCCTATPFTGAAGIAVDSPSLPIQLDVSEGTFAASLDLDDIDNFSAGFVSSSGGTVAAAIARFKAGLDGGKTYLNIHSSRFLGGEIRGFMVVPEPTSMALTLLALATLGAAAWRRRSA